MIVYSCRWMQNGFPNPKIERSHLHPSQAKKQRPVTPSIDSEAFLKGEWVVWWGIVASRVTKPSCRANFVSWEERGHNVGCAVNINTNTLLSYAVLCIAQCYAYFFTFISLLTLLCNVTKQCREVKLLLYITLIGNSGEQWWHWYWLPLQFFLLFTFCLGILVLVKRQWWWGRRC